MTSLRSQRTNAPSQHVASHDNVVSRSPDRDTLHDLRSPSATAKPLDRIPILDLAPEIDALWDEIQKAMHDVVRSGHFILGPQVQAFEKEAAEYLGAAYAIGCNSGTDALVIGLRALGIGPGDEVITSSFTFFATAEAISMVGATPVFVDIEPESMNVDPALIEREVTPRTKAIIPVHLFGHAAEMDQIRGIADRHGLKILEDTAQAFGGNFRDRKLGTLGDIGAFSFFPSKNLGAFGDGGLITTNNPELAELARVLRTHGSRKKYQNDMLGYNSRLDELQAAILRVKLPHVDTWNEGRRTAASYYEQLLAEFDWLRTPTSENYTNHVFHQYTVRVVGRDREEIRQHLDNNGIGTMVYYPVPVHRLPVYADQNWKLPVTEAAATQVLSLPIGPSLSEATIERIVDVLRTA
ncbi:MAG: DegT/DnrJ/EryC1/StrS family aminotransferase [Planctomycetaceae bacterium]